MPKTFGDAVLIILRDAGIEWMRQQFYKPDGWEADPKTRTIRRRRPPVVEAKATCARCGEMPCLPECASTE